MKSKRLLSVTFMLKKDGSLDVEEHVRGYRSGWVFLRPREAEALRKFLNENAEE